MELNFKLEGHVETLIEILTSNSYTKPEVLLHRLSQ